MQDLRRRGRAVPDGREGHPETAIKILPRVLRSNEPSYAKGGAGAANCETIRGGVFFSGAD